jgi:hypothetical protein
MNANDTVSDVLQGRSVMADDTLVEVLVPRHLVTQVYAFVADAERRQSRAAETILDMAREPAEWPDDLVRRAYAESSPTLKRVLRALADRPNQDVVSDELVGVIGPKAEWPNLAGTLGAFGRRIRSRYQQEGPFFSARWDYERNKMVYNMPSRAAEVIEATVTG